MTRSLLALFLLLTALPASGQSPADIVQQAVAEGRLAFRLTSRAEIEAMLGAPDVVIEEVDGGMEGLHLQYGEIVLRLWRSRDGDQPHTLRVVELASTTLDIGQQRQLALRTEVDLALLDSFVGLQDVSLERLDLREHGDLLDSLPFDTLTAWPAPQLLPSGFDPAARLRSGRNPGLGIRALHAKGIDGHGVHVAYIDQPLLLPHVEYADRVTRYRAVDVDGVEPQMHGPPVTTVAVGATAGVAPGATMTYYAQPSWRTDNTLYARLLDELVAFNESAPHDERVRIVGISYGGFSLHPHHDVWEQALARARAAGMLVFTCEQDRIDYGMLTLKPGQDPDDPGSYVRARRSGPTDQLLLPGGNRTYASHRGSDVYWVDPDPGLSWGAPYLVGLAALALQVNPTATPANVEQGMLETAVATDIGPVVQPGAFVEWIARRSTATTPGTGGEDRRVHAVTFSHHSPDAAAVSLVGEMNGWQPGATPMTRGDDGVWSATVPLGPGQWLYKFHVDGQWLPDDLNPLSTPDGHGSRHSWVLVGDGDFRRHDGVPHGRIELVEIPSALLGVDVEAGVYFSPEVEGPLPYLVLLHGQGMDRRQWIDNGLVAEFMDNLIHRGAIEPFVVIMPSTTPHVQREELDAFLADDLPGWLFSSGLASRDGPPGALGGFSMGGSQTLRIAALHPDAYGLWLPVAGWIPDEHRRAWFPLLAAGHPVVAYCGAEDPVPVEFNRLLAQQLASPHGHHEYVELPGGHSFRLLNTATVDLLVRASRFYESGSGSGSE